MWSPDSVWTSSPSSSESLISDDPGSFSIHGAQPIVSAPEPELRRRRAEHDAGGDLGHLVPGNPHEPATRQPGRQPTEPTAPLPGRRAAEDRNDSWLAPADPLELEVVDVAATAAVAVQQLVVEHAEPEVDLRHPWPMFERRSRGIAATAITSTTTR